MKSKYLIKNNSKKLIIFFNGWSLDENIVKNLETINYDVLMLYDYENIEIPEDVLKEIDKYDNLNIIAWSFGVWACCTVINQFNKLKNVVAINGTPIPIDDNFGIPEKIFNLTLTNMSEKNYPRFYKNMFNIFEEKFFSMLSNRNATSQIQELTMIQKQASEQIPLQKINQFNKVFISTQDKIIPAKNQLNFWSNQNDLKIFELEKGHYIFDLFKTWDEIINYE